MYTELYLSCELKIDLPPKVLEVLQCLFNGKERPSNLPKHEFFKCDRWSCIGRCSSYYFVPFNTSKLYFDDRVTKQYFLTTRSDLKNYDGEIEKFLDWIMPYIEEPWGGHLGHYRYEEDDAPTLIYYSKVGE